MDEETTKKIKEVCRIEIIFPVESDEKALEIKKAIGETLKDVPNKRFTFGLAEN